MLLLILFAFLAGIVTILSPCILPILPIVLAATVGGGKKRPLGIIIGFIASFTFFTLFLAAIVKLTHISPDALRTISIGLVFLFGLSLLVPKIKVAMEIAMSKIARFVPTRNPNSTNTKSGIASGILVGISLGLLWTPCVGPILASVISLALSGSVTSTAIVITLAYSAGTAIPMLTITYGGRQLLQKVPWLLINSGKIQKVFGVVMIATAVGIFFNLDRQVQTIVLEKFPQYGVGLTQFEESPLIKKALQSLSPKPMPTGARGKPSYQMSQPDIGTAPNLTAGGQWFNLPDGKTNLSLKELRGKVVLIDFWTYTCINCIRTLPYIKKWHELYKDKGLVIIGVHTPEFEFEKNPTNVAKALDDFGIKYPVVQDNDYATWNDYDNHYWPAKYIIDKNGKIRNTHFGEGNYDQTEKIIQGLLEETGVTITNKPDNKEYQLYAQTPESYLGSERLAAFSSPQEVATDKLVNYSIPENISDNSMAYGGSWTVGSQYAMPHQNAELALRFESKEVYLVMRSGKPGTTQQVKVLLDGKPIDAANSGDDVKDAVVTVIEDRLYKLVSLTTPGKHQLTLVFVDDGVELYAFTFG